jgi:hypothetical protein
MKQSLIVAFVLLLAVSAHATELAEAQAHKLVRAYLIDSAPRTLSLPGFGFDGWSRSGRYRTISAIWDNPGPGSIVVGAFWVDPRTADLWDTTCEIPLATRHLTRLQVQLRRSMGLTPARYRFLRTSKGPCG